MSTDDLEDRLRRLGQAPIAPEVEASHRRGMALALAERPRARFGWKAVALAALAGFVVGSTSLAAAGSLPAPAQDVAHDVLGVVGIGVPRSTEGCPAGTSYRNHGEYVSAVEAAGGDVDAAAHSDCGKPAHSGKGKGNGTDKEKGPPGAQADGDADEEEKEDPASKSDATTTTVSDGTTTTVPHGTTTTDTPDTTESTTTTTTTQP